MYDITKEEYLSILRQREYRKEQRNEVIECIKKIVEGAGMKMSINEGKQIVIEIDWR